MTSLARKNGRVAVFAGLLAVAMIGLAFAAVPLYRLFCQVTGLGGTTMRAEESAAAMVQPVAGKSVSIRFDANVSRDLTWQFKPQETQRTVPIGARNMTAYSARNMTSRPLTGTATFNVTPVQAGKYFSKVQCFCFQEQTLQPGEEVRMPVVFYVDPAILDDPDARKISEITLSYTFFPVDSEKEPS